MWSAALDCWFEWHFLTATAAALLSSSLRSTDPCATSLEPRHCLSITCSSKSEADQRRILVSLTHYERIVSGSANPKPIANRFH